MAHALDNMRKALETFAERNKVYGDNYLKFGKVMEAIFPEGITLKTERDFNRFGILFPIITKLTRYLNDPNKGHIDSIHDIGVYSFMLEQLDAMPVPVPEDVREIFRQATGGHELKEYCEHVFRRDTDGNMRCIVKECLAYKDGPMFAHHTHLWDTAAMQDYSKCKICSITWKEYREAMAHDHLGH